MRVLIASVAFLVVAALCTVQEVSCKRQTRESRKLAKMGRDCSGCFERARPPKTEETRKK